MGKDVLITAKRLSSQKGYVQKDRVEYDEAFASFGLFDVLLLIVRKFTAVGCHVHHAILCTAFMNGDFDHELYVQGDNKCFELEKSMHGSKQSLHIHHENVENTLERLDSRHSSRASAFSCLKRTRQK